MGFLTVFTLTLISSSIVLLLLSGPASGTNIRINLASTLDPREAWPWPFDDSKTSYILFEVDPGRTPDDLYYFVGISLIGQSDQEVKKLDSLRCVNPSLLSGRFVTLLPDSIPTSRPIPVFHETSFKVKLGANDESIILTSAFGDKTYGNARSVSLKAGDKTFVLQVMRELAEPEKMDIFILSRNETIQLEGAIWRSLTAELKDDYKLIMTYDSCIPIGGKNQPIYPFTPWSNNKPDNPSTKWGNNQLPIDDDKQSTVQPPIEDDKQSTVQPPIEDDKQSTVQPPIADDKQSTVQPPIDASTSNTTGSSNGYKLQPTSVLILLSISHFRSGVSYLLQ